MRCYTCQEKNLETNQLFLRVSIYFFGYEGLNAGHCICEAGGAITKITPHPKSPYIFLIFNWSVLFCVTIKTLMLEDTQINQVAN